MTAFRKYARLGTAALLLGAVGCDGLPSPPPLPVVQPDMKAIAAVVEDAYGRLGQAPSVFLGADAVQDTTMARVRFSLNNSPQ